MITKEALLTLKAAIQAPRLRLGPFFDGMDWKRTPAPVLHLPSDLFTNRALQIAEALTPILIKECHFSAPDSTKGILIWGPCTLILDLNDWKDLSDNESRT